MKRYLTFEPFFLLVLIWLVFFADLIVPIDFTQYGIRPRSVFGLFGIFSSPLLHASFYHIISNSIPLVMLGMIVRLNGVNIFWLVTIIIVVLGGVITWLISSSGVVVGASGLIFGYWSFAIAYGFFRRSFLSLMLSLLVIVFYGTMIFSFLKFYPHISWAGHFAGALSGLIAARYIHSKYKK